MVEISDKDALDLFKNDSSNKVKIATVQASKTIVYPVEVERRPGEVTREIREFVRAYEYYSPSQWDKALEYEKKYPQLNKEYRKARGLPESVKVVANPLKATPIGVR